MSSTNNLKNRFDDRILELLKSIAQEEAIVHYEIKNTTSSSQVDGYMGIITAISITGRTSSSEDKTLQLIVKAASKSNALRIHIPVIFGCEQEIYIYNFVIPAFRKFEMERNAPPFSSSASFYKACLIDKSEALVLENLNDRGYSQWEKTTPMEHDHVSLVMAELGHFHAVPLAMRDQEPVKFETLTNNMYAAYDLLPVMESYTKLFRIPCEKALKCLDVVNDRKAYIKFKKFIDEELKEYFKSRLKSVDNYSAIVHGDCWVTNMLFKYEDKYHLKKPTKMCLLDFQLTRLGPPVLDLLYFLYASSSKQVLDNYEYYLNIYHSRLSAHLRKLGSDPELVYPTSVFQEQWKKFSRFGLIYSMTLLRIMFTQQNEVVNFADALESGKRVEDFFDYDIADDEIYNDRARHIILHFVNNGYL